MNISEANAVNALLRFLADPEASLYDEQKVAEQVTFLAGRAHTALGAGPSEAEVRDLTWPRIAGRLRAADSDGAAQAVCAALAAHKSHGGAIPWPSIADPLEVWELHRELQA